jgi:hypothetical protein
MNKEGKEMFDINHFSAIQVGLASPEKSVVGHMVK